MRRTDLGVIAFTLAGVFLIYHAIAPALRALIWLAKFADARGSVMPSDVLMYLGFPVLLATVGCLFVARRHSLARHLFSDAEPESEGESAGSLASMFTAVGMLLFTYGLVQLVELFTEWLLSTSTPDPAEAWPYRVSSVVEFAIGSILLLRSPYVADWVLSRQLGHGSPRR